MRTGNGLEVVLLLGDYSINFDTRAASQRVCYVFEQA